MKKSLLKIALAVLAFAFLFASCSNTVSSDSSPETPSTPAVQPAPTPAPNPNPEPESTPNPALEIPLTLEALEDNTTITLLRAYRVKGLKYSIDGKDPVEVSSSPAYNSGNVEIPLSTGSCISFYGEGTDNDKYNNFCIICSADCYVYGNVMSLLFSDFKDKTVITQEYAFIRLFGGGIKNSLQKELLLPATSLAEGCYYMMFSYCTSLTTAPVLPATCLARECYECMFYNCTSLETPPVLPATSLEVNCYRRMFNGCTSLIKAPDLPATSLASYCYYGMFDGCESLTKAPDLPAISLEDGSYYWMFRDCKALETAPVLPATSLSDWCYYGMFSGCCKLNYVKCLAKDISAKKCLDDWLSGVADTGTFVKSSSASWAVAGQNGIPADWEVKDAADN